MTLEGTNRALPYDESAEQQVLGSLQGFGRDADPVVGIQPHLRHQIRDVDVPVRHACVMRGSQQVINPVRVQV